MMRVAAIALGSNLPSIWGNLVCNLREAIHRVEAFGTVQAVSSFYDTTPVGYADQPRFLNGALLLATHLEAPELMRALLGIEKAMGRDRAAVPFKGPRVIDLDLLLMGDLVLATPELTLPHPALTDRRFVLEPLAEIAPEMVEPASGKTVKVLLAALAVE